MTTHPNEQISAYIDDELTDTEKADVEEHLKNCIECQAFADELFALKEGIFSTFEAVAVPEDLESLIMARIDEKELAISPVNLKVPWVGVTVAMVALLAVVTTFPFLIFGFGIVQTLFHLMISLSTIIPIIVASIPFLLSGLIVFTVILMFLSIWALKRVFERGGLVEKRVG